MNITTSTVSSIRDADLIEISNTNELNEIRITITKSKGSIMFSKTINIKNCLKIIIKGNCYSLSANNCAEIIGTVGYAKVGNCLMCKGTINTLEKIRNRVEIDKHLTKDDIINSSKKLTKTYGRANIIHIIGDCSLKIDVNNIACSTVLIGNCNSCEVVNSLNVLGNISSCAVENCVIAENINNMPTKSQCRQMYS